MDRLVQPVGVFAGCRISAKKVLMAVTRSCVTRCGRVAGNRLRRRQGCRSTQAVDSEPLLAYTRVCRESFDADTIKRTENAVPEARSAPERRLDEREANPCIRARRPDRYRPESDCPYAR